MAGVSSARGRRPADSRMRALGDSRVGDVVPRGELVGGVEVRDGVDGGVADEAVDGLGDSGVEERADGKRIHIVTMAGRRRTPRPRRKRRENGDRPGMGVVDGAFMGGGFGRREAQVSRRTTQRNGPRQIRTADLTLIRGCALTN